MGPDNDRSLSSIMYTSYFGFKENPFSLTPDPAYLYFGHHHKEVFDQLVYGIHERKGFIVITGGIGTGKTTLCRALLGTLDSSIRTALIFNAFISNTELFKTINKEFGIAEEESPEGKKDDIDRLNHFLHETFSRGGNAVLWIDEAQNLSRTVIEQIYMLSNLKTEREKLVQIVLAGQSELGQLLASPALRQLDQRIMVRYELKPLDKRDVKGYVEHRLGVAGGKGNVRFRKDALEAIYEYSQGNPRRINAICDRALLIAYSQDEFAVSQKTVQGAIEDILGHVRSEPRLGMGWAQKRVSSLSVLLLLLLFIVAGLGGWNFRTKISALISGEASVTSEPPRRTPAQAEGGQPLLHQAATEGWEVKTALIEERVLGAPETDAREREAPIEEMIGYYVARKGDSLWSIAARADVYGDPLKWPILYRLNMDKLGELQVGEGLPHREVPEGIRLRILSPHEIKDNLQRIAHNVWAVSVLSRTTDREIIPPAIRLIRNGYPVYITRARVKGKDWMRLRVGFFKDKTDAEKERQKIMSMLNLHGSWITKVAKQELEAFGGYY